MQWQEVVENLKEYSKTIAMSFLDTTAYVSGNYLLIDAKTDIPFQLLKRDPEQKDRIRDAVQELTGKRYNLGPYKPPVKRVGKENELDGAHSVRYRYTRIPSRFLSKAGCTCFSG